MDRATELLDHLTTMQLDNDVKIMGEESHLQLSHTHNGGVHTKVEAENSFPLTSYESQKNSSTKKIEEPYMWVSNQTH